MRFHRIVCAAAVAAACLAPGLARAAGYDIYEQGAAALGMAGAATASVHDASAVFFDPAAMTRLDGAQFQLGGSWLSTRISFAGVDPYPGFGTAEKMKSGNFFPPTVYWATPIRKTWAFGAGFNSPFGLGVEWENPGAFSGRRIATKARLQNLMGNANLAWAPSEWLSLAAGFDAMFASVELDRLVNLFPTTGGQDQNDASVKLSSGYKSGYGWNGAVLLTPGDLWRVALSYRARVDVDVDGDAAFTQIPSGDPARDAVVAANLPPGQPVHTTLKFPAIVSLGAAWKPAPAWTVEGDFNWTQWKAFDALDLTFPSDPSLNLDLVENYHDSFQLRLGAEHRLAGHTYRFGYYFDQAAAPPASVSPILPDANRHGAALGYGRAFGADRRLSLDVYELALFVENRSTDGEERDNFNGVYKSFVNIFGASLGYHW